VGGGLPINVLADGQMTAVRIDGVDVLLCRVEGRYFALSNSCSHARQALSTGRLRGFEVTCPLHGARFDIRSGKCLAAPATQPVPTFPVHVESGKLTVLVAGAAVAPEPRNGPPV
jgi:3-phenylpropionate/trans-cinnamate dioxygenase ferredoxin subunit